MRNRVLFASLALCGLAMIAGCNKENQNELLGLPEGALQLTTESPSNLDKTAVQGLAVRWVDGDEVNVNGDNYSVVLNGDVAYIDGSGITDAVYAYYPSNLVAFDGQTTEPTVTIPDTYSSVMGTADQVIPLPMVAYSPEVGSSIEFKHLSATVNVVMKNSFGNTLNVNKVMIRTHAQRINGSVTLDLSAANLGLAASYAATTEAERMVTVTFATPITISNGSQNTSVQVPIIPINGDKLTVEVYCTDNNNNEYHYIYTPDEAVIIGRNTVLTAGVNLDPNEDDNSGHMGKLINLSNATGDIFAKDGDILTGNLGIDKSIYVTEGATITLRDMEHRRYNNGSVVGCGIECLGDATIIVEGNNRLTGYDGAGIYIPENHTLIIRGTGILSSTSGGNFGCGIGSKGLGYNAGNIVIQSGTITVAGVCGAGIGGYDGCTCGNITITGGTVKATSRANGAAIGCGGYYHYTSNIYPTRDYSGANCGNILITGGTVTAENTDATAPAIGAANQATCGTITIAGGNVTAGNSSSSGSTPYAGIGCYNSTYQCGKITLSGGTITAMATTASRPASNTCAGIGVRGSQTYPEIEITDGVTSLTVTKNSNATYFIGNGTGNADNVTIDGVEGATPTSTFTHFTSSTNGNTWTLTHN